jgi:tripartite-type tricarboxylate transporter receptor subunit TctC
MIRKALVAIVIAALFGAGSASAQTYPSKPIRIIVNYGPGGGSDNMTRPFADRLSKALGQQVIIENILVAPKAAIQAVDLSLLRADTAQVVRISTVAEVAEQQVVEQEAFVIG